MSIILSSRIRPWTSHQWCVYFRRNATELLDVPWDSGAGLTPAERETIAESVREFQLGESAEGRHFIGAAKAYAARSGDREYVEAVRHLIGEEQRHARDLARFLKLAGIPLAGRCWADSAFRFLRKRAGLEVCVAVLVTAEIVAKIYYVALRDATGSVVLRRVCQQILSDEVAHVRFQSERLGLLRRQRSRVGRILANCVHRAMLATANFVVWRKHRRVLRAGGFRFTSYWRATWAELHAALREMNPTPRVAPRASRTRPARSNCA